MKLYILAVKVVGRLDSAFITSRNKVKKISTCLQLQKSIMENSFRLRWSFWMIYLFIYLLVSIWEIVILHTMFDSKSPGWHLFFFVGHTFFRIVKNGIIKIDQWTFRIQKNQRRRSLIKLCENSCKEELWRKELPLQRDCFEYETIKVFQLDMSDRINLKPWYS